MRQILILVLILLVQFSILFSEASFDSATTDENVHLPAGYSYLKFHDFRFNPEHPPLQKVWVALPLLFQEINLPTDFDALWQGAGRFEEDTWREAREFGEKLLYASNNDADTMLLSGRLMTILFALAITCLVYIWSGKLWGVKGGIISAALVAFSPLMLAHGKLTNTEISVTLFYLLSVWWLIKFLRSPGWKTALILGLFFGLLQLSKYTAIIFLPIAFISLVYWLWRKKKIWKEELKRLLPWIGLVLLIGWLIITLAYFPKIKFFYSPDYIKGLWLVVKHTAAGHSSYLIGQFSRTGWWYYFPFAFLVKSSLITLTLVAGMMIVYFKNQIKLKPEHHIIIIAILVYFLSSMTSRANLGARHLLPIYPFIFVLLGWWGTALNSKLKVIGGRLQLKVKIFVTLFLILFIGDSLSAFPYHISYFNQIIGIENGYKYLLDSNYDWGQEMKRVARYQKEVLGGKVVYLDYWWNGDLAPDYYGIKYIKMLPSMQEIKGTIVIGATSYMQPDYSWLRQYPIKDRIGKSVFVIELAANPDKPADLLEQPRLLDD
jgi:uncharacterized membrane protein